MRLNVLKRSLKRFLKITRLADDILFLPQYLCSSKDNEFQVHGKLAKQVGLSTKSKFRRLVTKDWELKKGNQ